MKKKTIFIILLMTLFISKINAESEYYDNIWIGSQGAKSNIIYGINDIAETEDGYLAVGPYDTFGNFDPTIYVLDENGRSISQIALGDYDSNLNYLDVLRILEIGEYYYAITETDYISSTNYTYIVKMDKKGKIMELYTIETPNFSIGSGYNDVEMILKESSDYIYITNNNKTAYLKVKKADFTGEVITFEQMPEEDKEIMGDLALAIENYYVQSEYKDGYFVFIDTKEDEEGNYLTSTFGYFNDGEIKWEVDIYYTNKFLSYGTTIEYNNLIIFVNYDIDEDPVLITIDENGKILEENKMLNYFTDVEDYDYYNFEHIIPATNGFFITGSYVFLEDAENIYIDERLSQSAPMYFRKKYNVYTKTDGNGKVESSITKGFEKDEVQFILTPNEGYVLGEVKVTDNEGNVVTFTDYTFTMPTSDVTIDATFIKEEPNPPTSDLSFVLIISLIVVSFIIIRKSTKKLSEL